MNRKPCVHCGRSIDEGARLCLYCNRNQAAPVSPRVQNAAAPPVRARRTDFGAGTRALMIAGVIALLTGTFAVGSLIYGLGSRDEAPASRRLVIQNEPDTAAPGATPLPAVPAPAADAAPVAVAPSPNGSGEPSDATALPASQYARVLSASQTAAAPAPTFAASDPRTVTGTPFPAAATRSVAAPKPKPQLPVETRRIEVRQPERTRPRPIDQPVPDVGSIAHGGTVRLNLTIGANGRVREIEILDGVPGVTTKIIDAARHWRFVPATEDGREVEANFLVNVSIKGYDD